jgi:drug/metabolite transporter (DMT)-like permease
VKGRTVTGESGIDRLALGAALVTVVLWASAFVGIRAAATDLSPGSLALGRLTVGSIALGLLVAARGWNRPTRRDAVFIAAFGLVWFAGYNLTLNEAERNVDAGTAAMLVNTGPIFIAVLAGIFLGEGFPGRLILGCLISFAGAVIIGAAVSGESQVQGDSTIGIVLCIVAAIAYASGVTLQKPALRRVSALEVTFLGCVVGMIACLPFAPSLVDELTAAEPTSIAWLVYLGVFPTAIGFTTWAFALSRTPAGRLGSTTYLIPPVVIVISWLLLGEVPAVLAIAGGALCIGGVIVARSRGSLSRLTGSRQVPDPAVDAAMD